MTLISVSDEAPQKPSRSPIRIIAIAAAAILVIGLVVQFAVARANGLPDNAVLKFGGTTVTKAQFTKRLATLKALYGVEAPKSGAKLAKFNRDAAKSQAVSLILDKAAKKNGVVISSKAAEDTLGKLIDQQMPGGRTAFVQYLTSNRVSEANVLDEVKRQMSTTQLVEKIAGGQKTSTNAEAQAYYDSHKSDMVSPETRRLANIVVETESEATSIAKQAKRGASFATLASKYSQDASTKAKGGELGTLSPEQLEAAFAKAAFGAKKGAVFGPVKTRFGWNVGKVTAIHAKQPLAFKDVKSELLTELQREKELKVWRKWLAKEIKSADVKYADKYQPAHPDAAPAGLPN